jgi:predicted CoA-binding protein
MPIFVRLISFHSGGGQFDTKKDSRALNEVLQKLQDKGAHILSITPAMGGGTLQGIAATYTVTYEAPSPIE